jgi:hypothetical protein
MNKDAKGKLMYFSKFYIFWGQEGDICRTEKRNVDKGVEGQINVKQIKLN